MTWEDIYKKMIKYDVFGDNIQCKASVLAILEGELHNKVIIEKGENRHPFADVLHKMAEGEAFQQWHYGEEKWIDSSKRLYYDEKYRIKPSEPVYEWQWYYIKDGLATVPSNFYTEEEVDACTFVKIEETKRERKND